MNKIIADTALKNVGAKSEIPAKDYPILKKALERYIDAIPKGTQMIEKAREKWGAKVPEEERTRINRYIFENYLKHEETIRRICGQELANHVLNEIDQLRKVIGDWVD